MIRSLFTAVTALLISISAFAATTYSFIIPNPPGSASDVIARTMSEEYNRRTGNQLVVDYVPGGDHIIAVNKFKSRQQPTVILVTTSMSIFNFIFKENLPYGDADFDYTSYLGTMPSVWYVNANSKMQEPGDILKALADRPSLPVAVDAFQSRANVLAFKEYAPNGNRIEHIEYKGPAQALIDVVGGHIEIGVSTITPSLLAAAESGKIRFIGGAVDYTLNLNGQKIPSVTKQIKVPQFYAVFFIALNSNAQGDTAEIAKLKKDLHGVVNSKAVKDKLAELLIDIDGRDGIVAKQVAIEYRNHVKSIAKHFK